MNCYESISIKVACDITGKNRILYFDVNFLTRMPLFYSTKRLSEHLIDVIDDVFILLRTYAALF